ncbi:MAG: hypothetical protein Q8L22_10800, partial [Reyranella sp.]|nr:hypothetical protein [Reyranella sp.]
MIPTPLRAALRATTPARLPPPALAAAAGLHLLAGAAMLVAWQVSPTDETPLPVEIAVVVPAPPRPES